MKPDFYFERSHGSIYFMHRGQIRYMTDSPGPAFLFDRVNLYTLMHGPCGRINREMKKLREEGYPMGDVEDLVIVENPDWDIEFLNRILHTSSLLGTLIPQET